MGGAVAAIGVVIAVMSAIVVVSPTMLSRPLDELKSSPRRIYGLAVARLVIGVILVVGASSTAVPTLVLFIGAVFILRAVMIPLLGLDRTRSLIEWLQGRSSLFVRFVFLAGAALGVFLMWAAQLSDEASNGDVPLRLAVQVPGGGELSVEIDR